MLVLKSYQIKVYGIVQGVGFRYFTRNYAKENNLKGTVQNLPDGTVLIAVVGYERELRDFIKWCHEGPESARVDRLDYCKIPIKDYLNFEISR